MSRGQKIDKYLTELFISHFTVATSTFKTHLLPSYILYYKSELALQGLYTSAKLSLKSRHF